MALLEAVENGQENIVALRSELTKVRETLDRTVSILGVADDTLARAETAIVQSRRWAPVALAALGAVVIGVAVVVVLKRRGRKQAEDPEED